MIFKIKRLTEIETDDHAFLDDVYINTKNIVSIEQCIEHYDKESFWGIRINGTFIPLFFTNEYFAFAVYDKRTRTKIWKEYEKADINGKEKILTEAWDFASVKIDEILNQIVEAMEEDADNE